MRIQVGTSGYNYPEWQGSFYPARMSAAKMLPYYAARFPTVEINYTFYRMPDEKTVAGWTASTPDDFSFTLKAPKRLTHDARLRDCADGLRRFLEVAARLGPKRGALLFQTPPNLKKDLPLLEAFCEPLPPAARAAFEFRHASWFDDDVLDFLRGRGLALCVADSEKLSAPVVATAPYAYFRLRDEGYTPADIARWGDTIAREAAGCADVFVYFKHEDEGKGPAFARLLLTHLGLPAPDPAA